MFNGKPTTRAIGKSASKRTIPLSADVRQFNKKQIISRNAVQLKQPKVRPHMRPTPMEFEKSKKSLIGRHNAVAFMKRKNL